MKKRKKMSKEGTLTGMLAVVRVAQFPEMENPYIHRYNTHFVSSALPLPSLVLAPTYFCHSLVTLASLLLQSCGRGRLRVCT